MSLATTCPNCSTSFRVVADLLKLHGGRVRCGRCLTVFSALDQLRPLQDAAAPDDEEARGFPDARPDPAIPPAMAASPVEPSFRIDIELPPAASGVGRRATLSLDDDADPRGLFRVPPERQAPGAFDPGELPPLTAADDEPAVRGFGAGRTVDEPDDDFSGTQGLYSQPTAARRALPVLGALVLLAVLLFQVVLASRDWLSARYPVLKPAVVAMAGPLGLKVGAPRALDELVIASFELQPSSRPEFLAVSALLRNQARYPVRWPSLLLTLTDSGNRVLARRIIDPPDYLGQRSPESGVRARSEQPLRLALETEGVRPAGYSVVLFYR
jgi:predicted Zn finger-like uncharacterized protein